MVAAKFKIEKFNGKNDFGLWRIKMRAILVQQGLADALKGDKLPKAEEGKEKVAEMMDRAHRAIILYLGDKVLREVAKKTTAAAVWTRLESLYMTKSLANRLYIKQRLYSFKVLGEKGISDQLEEFNKILDDLENIEAKIEDEDKAIILLNALPKSYEHLKDAMLYGIESSITLDEIQTALRSKELQKASEGKADSNGEGLNIKQKAKKKFKKTFKDQKKDTQKKAIDDTEKETRTCHCCKKPGHLKKDCYAFKRKQAKQSS